MDFRAELINPRLSRELRRSVLRPNLRPGDPLPGDGESTAVHIGAFADIFHLASTCYIFPDPCPWQPDARPAGQTDWHLRQMATHPDYRGQGAGAAVLRTAVGYVAATGGGILWCNARVPAVGFYAGHGFVAHGEQHLSGDDPPLPHRYLWRLVEPAPATLSRDGLPESIVEVGEQVLDALDTDR